MSAALGKKPLADAAKGNSGPLAVAFSLLLIFGGCALNNLALEFIIRRVAALCPLSAPAPHLPPLTSPPRAHRPLTSHAP